MALPVAEGTLPSNGLYYVVLRAKTGEHQGSPARLRLFVAR